MAFQTYGTHPFLDNRPWFGMWKCAFTSLCTVSFAPKVLDSNILPPPPPVRFKHFALVDMSRLWRLTVAGRNKSLHKADVAHQLDGTRKRFREGLRHDGQVRSNDGSARLV